MFTLIFQSYYNGFKTEYFKIFLSDCSLLNFIHLPKFKNLLYTKELAHWMVPLHLNSLSNFLSLKNKAEEEEEEESDNNNEFEFYLLNDKKLKENEDDIREKTDLDFYESFNFEKMFFEFKLPENYFTRIICKHIKPVDDNVECDYFEENEINDITILQELDSVCNKRISTENYVFRKGREMDDLY